MPKLAAADEITHGDTRIHEMHNRAKFKKDLAHASMFSRSPLDKVFGYHEFPIDPACYRSGFISGPTIDLGFNGIRILRHMILPGAGGAEGRCDEKGLHSHECPTRYGCPCEGEHHYRDQFIQRLQ